ncbi:uncharacterized protein PHALS_06353 [Plasmopara halstedii]|uniref:Uncharacterized protein n=1 Tax=Plasmopara halstedii TaxID=4781 RepID=A0A0P1B2R3_PLAHL|nr:uncharacterized protein PHALS_06353 [Plasmopara halstedii]CEG48535.1 hypothetical protein PHALS_06353 [Plasmopara halstedii]|eukprot:XP_024584904.1 hypothetical protein PHALS_06353 [Plasmopara halstedii]
MSLRIRAEKFRGHPRKRWVSRFRATRVSWARALCSFFFLMRIMTDSASTQDRPTYPWWGNVDS